MASYSKEPNYYPLLPLRNVMIAPEMIIPVIIGRYKSKKALEKAYSQGNLLLTVPQRNTGIEDPKAKDLFRVGTLCNILQMFKLPDGNSRVLLEGVARVRINRLKNNKEMILANVKDESHLLDNEDESIEAYFRVLDNLFKEYVETNKNIQNQVIDYYNDKEDSIGKIYFVIANLDIQYAKKQELYEKSNPHEMLNLVMDFLNREIRLGDLERKIYKKVKSRLEKAQKDFFLNEQLKIIHQELGNTEDEKAEWQIFKEKIASLNLSEEAKNKAEQELKKMMKIPSHSHEYTVIYNYMITLLDLPWDKSEIGEISLKKAEKILENDHYGLKKVKERIIEYMAVLKISKKIKGQIICFVGPPGVGKTSLGKSIAKALGRKFVRLSLGGVRDEAEIRGHRRTYIGSMPGVIMQSMKKAGVKNPLILMDEIDKMSMDFRGDPSSALLEVLDPEQNNSFRDHYLDFGYDLSEVLFITTANTTASIPQPLLDRMELIHLPGYTPYEKYHIASKHLIPKVINLHDIKGKFNLDISKNTIQNIIEYYTREAGVRNLERSIAKIIRKTVKKYVDDPSKTKFSIKPTDLKELLGAPGKLFPELNKEDAVGIVHGLAWTMVGGEILEIEVIKFEGDGKLKITGQIGEVMQESAQAALSYAKFNASKFGIEKDFSKNYDLHLHVPEGAIPKDGPSAGITITTAIVSTLSDKKIRHDFAMTGEITLTGKVLPIGGLDEKLIAAKLAKIPNVIIPAKNDVNLEEVDKEIKKGINIHLVEHIDQVLELVIIN